MVVVVTVVGIVEDEVVLQVVALLVELVVLLVLMVGGFGGGGGGSDNTLAQLVFSWCGKLKTESDSSCILFGLKYKQITESKNIDEMSNEIKQI